MSLAAVKTKNMYLKYVDLVATDAPESAEYCLFVFVLISRKRLNV